MSEINFKRGDLVEVRDYETSNWQAAIFVAFVPRTKYPYLVIEDKNLTKEDLQEIINDSELAGINTFTFCRKKSSFVPIKIILNSEYTALVNTDSIYVGCQKFSFDKIDELSKAILEAKNFIEPE